MNPDPASYDSEGISAEDEKLDPNHLLLPKVQFPSKIKIQPAHYSFCSAINNEVPEQNLENPNEKVELILHREESESLKSLRKDNINIGNNDGNLKPIPALIKSRSSAYEFWLRQKSFSFPSVSYWFLNLLIVYPFICCGLWALSYILFGDDALPGGSVFALAILELLAILLGHVAESIQLPPLLGMLAAGLILGNVPYINFGADLQFTNSTLLRRISVVILLIRGALSVNPRAIKTFWNVIFKLSVCCCVVEAFIASLAVYFILELPAVWSPVLGCIFSSMSGVLVIPYLEMLESGGFGGDSAVLAIAKAACGLDAILGICLTKVALGFAFSDGFGEGLFKGVGEVFLGGLFGLMWGGLLGIFLNERNRTEIRTATVFTFGIISFVGSMKLGYPRGGPLGCFLGTLVSSSIWRAKNIDNDETNKHFTDMWYFFQPILFGVIGFRIDFGRVNSNFVLQGLLCFFIGVLVRFCLALLATRGILNLRERLFIAISWIPKATVQAALGPVVLELCTESGTSTQEEKELGFQIMATCGTVILLAATIGPLLIMIFAPNLLSRKPLL